MTHDYFNLGELPEDPELDVVEVEYEPMKKPIKQTELEITFELSEVDYYRFWHRLFITALTRLQERGNR